VQVISIGRVIRAPITDVFDAWVDPRLMAIWLKPRPDVITTVAVDSRAGGTLRVTMQAGSREEIHEGVYRLIDRPNRLSFTWSSAPAGVDTVISISFLASDQGRTMLLLTHDGLRDRAAAENHREGWRRILDSLAALLEGRS
jgi:uncharacterized protein YndB with AHSA1/START domain